MPPTPLVLVSSRGGEPESPRTPASIDLGARVRLTYTDAGDGRDKTLEFDGYGVLVELGQLATLLVWAATL